MTDDTAVTVIGGTLHAAVMRLSGQLMPRSRTIYAYDIRHFSEWLAANGLQLANLDGDHIADYRAHLAETYAITTAARMFSVCRRILEVAVQRGQLERNPAEHIKGFKRKDDETPHTALTKDQAKDLLAVIDRSTLQGKRDYALIMLLLRTGMRRAECSLLTLADIKQDRGHTVITIEHGKGGKQRRAKLPVDVLRSISAYLEALGPRPLDAPLFVSLRRGKGSALSARTIEYLIKAHARKAFGAMLDLSPHGLRATFVTLALEGGAPLHKVQYAAGHADPRTTERYQRRKEDLDDNAVDYIHM